MPLQSLSAVVQIDFQQKEADLFAPQSILPWFAWDTKLGSLTLHLDSTQTFAAEVYAYSMGLQVLISSCMASFLRSFVCVSSSRIVCLFACLLMHSCTHSAIQHVSYPRVCTVLSSCSGFRDCFILCSPHSCVLACAQQHVIVQALMWPTHALQNRKHQFAVPFIVMPRL